MMGRLVVILWNVQLTAFLYCDWLYFPWHHIQDHIPLVLNFSTLVTDLF